MTTSYLFITSTKSDSHSNAARDLLDGSRSEDKRPRALHFRVPSFRFARLESIWQFRSDPITHRSKRESTSTKSHTVLSNCDGRTPHIRCSHAQHFGPNEAIGAHGPQIPWLSATADRADYKACPTHSTMDQRQFDSPTFKGIASELPARG